MWRRSVSACAIAVPLSAAEVSALHQVKHRRIVKDPEPAVTGDGGTKTR